MLYFQCDYLQGACPEILKRLNDTNDTCFIGYGADDICASAIARIRRAVGIDDADVWFTVGGTQTNQLVIDAMLARYEGVVSVDTGHVNTHESGAIEFTGHKVMPLPQHDGKMCPKDLKALLVSFYNDTTYEHQVFPGMVYISQPTEFGTLYSRAEIEAITAVAHEYNLPVFVDGARLPYALASKANDCSLKELAQLVDAFYIGGTKCGTLFGEAIVFTKHNTPKHFFTLRKEHGALLCKGWLLGIQFDELFTDDLYMKLARHCMDMAEYMKTGIAAKGYKFYMDSPTNQQFVIIPNEKLEELDGKVVYSHNGPFDENNSIIRFCTSWATKKEQVDELLALL